MNKRTLLRQKVWLKYNKHCAYCGKDLEYKDMQVDHMISIYAREAYNFIPKISLSAINSFKNLMPSCRRCNHYKREQDLEGFRILIKILHERISDQYISKVAIDYGIIEVRPFDGVFYFEKNKGE